MIRTVNTSVDTVVREIERRKHHNAVSIERLLDLLCQPIHLFSLPFPECHRPEAPTLPGVSRPAQCKPPSVILGRLSRMLSISGILRLFSSAYLIVSRISPSLINSQPFVIRDYSFHLLIFLSYGQNTLSFRNTLSFYNITFRSDDLITNRPHMISQCADALCRFLTGTDFLSYREYFFRSDSGDRFGMITLAPASIPCSPAVFPMIVPSAVVAGSRIFGFIRRITDSRKTVSSPLRQEYPETACPAAE